MAADGITRIQTDASGLAEALKVNIPPGTSGSAEILRVQWNERTPWMRPTPRPKPGVYTELHIDGACWMSDVETEVLEQLDFLAALQRAPRDSRILIVGLGLGVVLHGAMLMEHKGRIDVVEKSGDVLALVGPHYEEAARITETNLHLHLADAYTWQWPDNARWHMTWIDIHRDIIETNLPEIAALESRYAPRSLWIGTWSKREAEWLRGEREAGRVVPNVAQAT